MMMSSKHLLLVKSLTDTTFPIVLFNYFTDDFKRITEGKDKGAYYHELFLYGRPALTTQMRRTKIKGNAALQQPAPVDFYQMPPVVAPSQQLQLVKPLDVAIAISG
jgi:hypothetical protein